jgi:hypothetical protein
VLDDSPGAIDGDAVYRKSPLGTAHLAVAHDDLLSPRERQVLVLLDGERTVGTLCEFFGRETITTLLAGLEAKGLTERGERSRRMPRLGGGPSSRGPSGSQRRWHHDWFALVNLGMLALVLAIAWGVLVAVDRHRADAGASEVDGARASPADAPDDSDDPQRAAADAIAPLSHMLAGDPARARPPVAGASVTGRPGQPLRGR